MLETANEMIIIRLWTKLPCKTLRNLIINLYDDVEVDSSVPIYSYFEWRKGPFKVGKGYTVVGRVPAKNGVRESKKYDYSPGQYWLPFL